jgi:hypothetical protein
MAVTTTKTNKYCFIFLLLPTCVYPHLYKAQLRVFANIGKYPQQSTDYQYFIMKEIPRKQEQDHQAAADKFW